MYKYKIYMMYVYIYTYIIYIYHMYIYISYVYVHISYIYMYIYIYHIYIYIQYIYIHTIYSWIYNCYITAITDNIGIYMGLYEKHSDTPIPWPSERMEQVTATMSQPLQLKLTPSGSL